MHLIFVYDLTAIDLTEEALCSLNSIIMEYFFKKKWLYCLAFVVKFSFLKSVESIPVLKKCPASAGTMFFCLIFWRYKDIIHIILS